MDGREGSLVHTLPAALRISRPKSPKPIFVRLRERIASKIDPAIWPPPFTESQVRSDFVIENRPIQGVLHQSLPLSKDERVWIRWPVKILFHPTSLIILPILIIFIVGVIVYYTLSGR
ncbi:hypothetical protein F5Y12DRAFT_710547 [Xylaria sp. FL1777]|nr:hypothetical protein F5Y12DRAFT_710547 [Xylaria sp. FL1777]